MGWLDAFLKRALIIGSVLVIVVLSGVAIYSAFNASSDRNSAVPDEEASAQVASPPRRVVPGARVEVSDGISPLSIGCLPSTQDDGTYVIAIQNQGRAEARYTVAATVVDSAGATADMTVEIPPLLPGQEVERSIGSKPSLEDIESCSVTAVQTDHRIVLFG